MDAGTMLGIFLQPFVLVVMVWIIIRPVSRFILSRNLPGWLRKLLLHRIS